MSAPHDIVDALECVLSIYFSGVRHNLRAAFILCDETVEVALLAKVRLSVPTIGRMRFPQLCDRAETGLNHRTHALGRKLYATHNSRNDMQHSNAAATVDTQRCADAIVDAVECIEHCFPGSKAALDEKMKVALRVVRIYSGLGTAAHRAQFEEGMMQRTWRGQRRHVKRTQTAVSPGMRSNWGLVVLSEVAAIEAILNQIGAP